MENFGFFTESITAWGGAGLFLLLLLITIFPLPLPEDFIVLSAGYLMAAGLVSLWSGSFFTILGVFTGDALLFEAGRILGSRVFTLWPLRLVFTAEKTRRFHALVEKYRFGLLPVARLVFGMRSQIYFASGLFGLSRAHFYSLNAMLCLIHLPLVMLIGWILREKTQVLLLWLRRLSPYLAIFGLVSIFVLIFIFLRRGRKSAPAESGKTGSP